MSDPGDGGEGGEGVGWVQGMYSIVIGLTGRGEGAATNEKNSVKSLPGGHF